MFCVSCGKRLETGMRFCPACGAVVEGATGEASTAGAGVPPPPPPGGFGRAARTPVLLRPREGRVIAGVCAAFAQHYGWDVMLVRILTGLVALMTIVGLGVYVVAWIVIPEAPYALPDASR